jgi:hypothetical protein
MCFCTWREKRTAAMRRAHTMLATTITVFTHIKGVVGLSVT